MKMRLRHLLIPSVLALSACTTLQLSEDLSPIEAIVAAQDKPTGGVFRLRVKATGAQDGWTYLNSESDYRDQRNLSIELTSGAHRELMRKFGEDPATYLKGKLIRVRGIAQRVTINISYQGIPTGKYYYQTHVRVSDASQISVVDEP